MTTAADGRYGSLCPKLRHGKESASTLDCDQSFAVMDLEGLRYKGPRQREPLCTVAGKQGEQPPCFSVSYQPRSIAVD
jgi:hypothetical protein